MSAEYKEIRYIELLCITIWKLGCQSFVGRHSNDDEFLLTMCPVVWWMGALPTLWLNLPTLWLNRPGEIDADESR
jgi:hypothetical protein